MSIQRAKIIIVSEAAAGAVAGACAGVLLISVPWMWRTFTSGAPPEQTVIARSIALGIERVLSIFVNWPVWEAAAMAGGLVGLIVGVITGYIIRITHSKTPGGTSGVVMGAMTGFMLLESMGAVIAGDGLGLATGLIIGLYPGGWIGFVIGGIVGTIPWGFADRLDRQQDRRMREEQEIEQKNLYDQIDKLITYFMEKMQEVGSPGLTEPRDDPNGCYFRSYGRDGDYSELPWHAKGVWLMPNGLTYACIYPDGKWIYIAPIFNNHTNEVVYYWRLESGGDRLEPKCSFPEEPYEATHQIAYSLVRQLVVVQLTVHNPSALTELPFS